MLARTPPPLRPFVDLGQRCAARLIELEVFDRSMALAGQAFAALLPLLIVIGAASPVRRPRRRRHADRGVPALGLGRGRAAQRADPAARARELGEHPLLPHPRDLGAVVHPRDAAPLRPRLAAARRWACAGNVWGLAWLASFIAWSSIQPLIVSLFDGVARASSSPRRWPPCSGC